MTDTTENSQAVERAGHDSNFDILDALVNVETKNAGSYNTGLSTEAANQLGVQRFPGYPYGDRVGR
jgi:hypothetical protein